MARALFWKESQTICWQWSMKTWGSRHSAKNALHGLPLAEWCCFLIEKCLECEYIFIYLHIYMHEWIYTDMSVSFSLSLSLYVSECVLGLLPPPQASIMPCKLKFVVKTNAKYQDNQRTKVLIFFEVWRWHRIRTPCSSDWNSLRNPISSPEGNLQDTWLFAVQLDLTNASFVCIQCYWWELCMHRSWSHSGLPFPTLPYA